MTSTIELVTSFFDYCLGSTLIPRSLITIILSISNTTSARSFLTSLLSWSLSLTPSPQSSDYGAPYPPLPPFRTQRSALVTSNPAFRPNLISNACSRFPSFFRTKVQAVLTLLWTLHLPIIQPASPSTLVARTLRHILGKNIRSYTFVDFCSGAGGPTPEIENVVNADLRVRGNQRNGDVADARGVDFVMTDIFPHLAAWQAAAKRSENLHYVSAPVDASDSPQNLLALANAPAQDKKKIFRLFSLAFHHFDDPLAAKILRNTLSTSSGFAILELQSRSLGSLFTVLLIGPLLWLGSWYWFWGQWSHLFFTYVMPIVPAVVVFDGIISSLRTRTPEEVLGLLTGEEEGMACWAGGGFKWGGENHTQTGGEMSWFIGVKGEDMRGW